MKRQTQRKPTRRQSAAVRKKPTRRNSTKSQALPKSANDSSNSHVLLRVWAEPGLTVEAHQMMIARYGVALFGKFGGPLGPSFSDALNHQIANRQKTYLFLVTRSAPRRNDYSMYRCPLRQVHSTLEPSKRHLVPGYYIGQAPDIRTWFEIEDMEFLKLDDIKRIFVISSGRDITSAIHSMSAVFRVGIRKALPASVTK